MFLFCLVFAMSLCASVYMYFVVTCSERADLLALVCGVYCEFVTFICTLWSPVQKGLTSWLSFVVSIVSLSLSHWYPGSGVVLDCIHS